MNMRPMKSCCCIALGLIMMLSAPHSVASVTTEVAKLLASDGDVDDNFGLAVAVDGDTIVVGARSDDDNASNAGSAYVFVGSGSTWIQQAKLTASDASSPANFGISVAIDGDTAVIGAWDAHGGGLFDGAAYVFVRTGTTWTEQAILTASDGTTGDKFGSSVAISGETVLVGAYWSDDPPTQSGSAYVFVRSGTTWSQEAELGASDNAANDRFGFAVALDGDTAVIGAVFDDDAGDNSGSAYVFTRSGTAWTEDAKLTASDAAAGDAFGYRIDVNGATAIIGAIADDDDGSSSGSAYVFVLDGGSWDEEAKLVASDGGAAQNFGRDIAVDGNLAVVGASGGGKDTAYLFKRSGTTWNEDTKLKASDADAFSEFFGAEIGFDGVTVVIGAWRDDKGDNSGSAYVFELDPVIVAVAIDIKPGSFPNSINLGSGGATPVAILGSASLDVNDIDTATLTLGTSGVKTVGKTDRTLCSGVDVSGDFSFGPDGAPDGFNDLVCHFVTMGIVPEEGDTQAKILGELNDTTPIEGTDSVNIVP